MTVAVPPIQSARLDLISMAPPFLEACLAGDSQAATALLGLPVAAEWLDARWLMELRLEQMRAAPEAQPWLLRAVVDRSAHAMVGAIGFHAPPGDPDLQQYAPNGVELGYRIFEPFRRQGYAAEACAAMLAWAHDVQHIGRCVLSISPDNVPSLRIAEKFGFRKVRTRIDDQDGPEDVFVRDLANAPDAL